MSLEEFASRPQVREYAAVLNTTNPVDPSYQDTRGLLMQDHLQPMVEKDTGFLEMFLLRASDGLILASTDETHEGWYREREAYFLEGKNGTHVQNVYYSLILEEPSMTIGTPVLDRQDRLVGVLATRVDLAEMSDITQQGRTADTSHEGYLVNKFNFFVTGSRFEPGNPLQKAVYTQGVEDCLEHKSAVALYDDYRGVPVIGAYRWVPGLEMCILTEVDQAEAFRPTLALRNTILGAAMVVGLIVAMLAVAFAQSVIQPLEQLVKGAETIGRGELDHRIQVTSSDEIGQLAGAFNGMAANLQDAQERLVRSEKLAVLGQLAGSVAHELRNPLGVIFNAVYYLKSVALFPGQPADDDPQDEILREYLEMITGEVRKSEKIISDLLDFSRTKIADSEMIQISILLESIFDRHPPPEGVETGVEIADGLPPAYVDPAQIDMVLGNLITNAYQAMPDGGRVSIRADMPSADERDASPEHSIRIRVSDTGTGISPQNLEKIFEALYTTKARGIGLGLALSRDLLEANSGSIQVESQEGKGSTFTVWLPVGDGE